MSDIFMKAPKEFFKPLIQSETTYSSLQCVNTICWCTKWCDQEEAVDIKKKSFNIVRME